MNRLKVPLRNVFRNKRRTGFSVIIIALGVAILLATLAFTDEAITSTKSSLASDSGAVQIAAPELFSQETKGFNYLIGPEEQEEIFSLIEGREGIRGATSRLEFGALARNEGNETTVVARGIVPGNCVQDYKCILQKGSPLSTAKEDGIVLGRSLADELRVDVGDKFYLSYSKIGGSFTTAAVEVVGLANFSNAMFESRFALTTLEFAQSLIDTEGVGRIIVRLEDIEDTDKFTNILQEGITGADLRYETRSWKALNPVFGSLSTFWNAFSNFTYLAVFTLVFFSTLEVLTMAFLERTSEVGTIKAIGMTRWEVFRDFLVEGALVGIIGGLLGLGLGALIGLVVNLSGITWKPPGATIPETLTIKLTFTTVLFPFIAAIISTTFGSLIPAWKNSKISIVEALRDG